MIAADIDECMGWTQPAVLHWAQDATQNLYTHLANWEARFAINFNENVEAERTVRNWKVPLNWMLARVPNANCDQTAYASECFRIVYGSVSAVKYAQLAGRISAGQLAAMLAAWNLDWGF